MSNIFVIWVPEGKKEKKNGIGKENEAKLEETTTENVLNLVRDTTLQI